MNAWQRLDDGNAVTNVGFRTVVSKTFKMNNGIIMQADVGGADGAEAAVIVALTPENKVIIARQFRCGPEMVLDELPGGLVDPGESPEQSAHRELREEVGYDSDEFEYLGKIYTNAWDNMRHHIYFARNCYKVNDGIPEQHEEIEIDIISIDELIDNAMRGNMTDIQAVLLSYNKLQAIKENV